MKVISKITFSLHTKSYYSHVCDELPHYCLHESYLEQQLKVLLQVQFTS